MRQIYNLKLIHRSLKIQKKTYKTNATTTIKEHQDIMIKNLMPPIGIIYN